MKIHESSRPEKALAIQIRVTRVAAAMMLLFSAFLAPMAHAKGLSLDAAKTAAANGGTVALVSYADNLQFGWIYGLLYIEAHRLVDRRISPGDQEKEPLMMHIRCVQGLKPQDLVTKALGMNPSRPDLGINVDLFANALTIVIADLCPPPSIEFKSERSNRPAR
jgi:hypothetical protein